MIKSDEKPYIMIPNITVQNIKADKEMRSSYVQLLGKKTVMYLRQLLELENVKGYSYFSINQILWMSKNYSNIQKERKSLKEFLIKLKNNLLIDCPDDIDNKTANDFLKVRINIHDYNEKGKEQNYFKLLDSEFNMIMNNY